MVVLASLWKRRRRVVKRPETRRGAQKNPEPSTQSSKAGALVAAASSANHGRKKELSLADQLPTFGNLGRGPKWVNTGFLPEKVLALSHLADVAGDLQNAGAIGP